MIIWLSDPKEKLGGVHILGVHKGGTTRIFEVLTSHAKICGTTPKQHLYFFSDEFSTDFDQFKLSTAIDALPAQKFVDATPDHFFDLRAVDNIDRLESNRLMLVSLRNPIDRAYSHWVMNNGSNKRSQFMSGPPKSCIDRGLYFNALKTYMSIDVGGFGVAIFEQWTEQENVFFDEIARALQINKELFSFEKASKNAPYKSMMVKGLVRRLPRQFKLAFPRTLRSYIRSKITGYAGQGVLTVDEKRSLLPLFESDIEASSDLLNMDLLNIWNLE